MNTSGKFEKRGGLGGDEINYRKFSLRRRNRMCPEAESSRRSEARMIHGRPGRFPSTETSLAFRTDRPRAEDPGRSGRSELSGSDDCPATCER